MKEINPLERIRGLCTERGWTYYQLSKASGIKIICPPFPLSRSCAVVSVFLCQSFSKREEARGDSRRTRADAWHSTPLCPRKTGNWRWLS